MESIKARDELVEKLVEKIRTEYESAKSKFFETIDWSVRNTLRTDTDAELSYMSFKTTLLTWIKEIILDKNGSMFRMYMQREGDLASFYVSTDCIEILLEAHDTVSFLASRFSLNLSGLYHLFTIDETNADRILVSVFEYAVHRAKPLTS